MVVDIHIYHANWEFVTPPIPTVGGRVNFQVNIENWGVFEIIIEWQLIFGPAIVLVI